MTKFWKTVLLVAGCGVALSASALDASRGLRVVRIKDREGKEIQLYKGSHALLIGVSDYTAGWPDLRSIPGELAEVQSTLERHGFVVRKHLNPTSANLKDLFEDFIGDYGYDPNNRLLFYYSGHGYSRKEGTKGYLVPADAPDPRRDARGFLRQSLSMTQVLTWCKEMEAKHALFLFDSCFSGTIFKSKALPQYPPYISEITSRSVRQFISAGDAGEEVPARSVFTPCFIRALRGEADLSGDGYVTGAELGMYIRDKVLTYRTGQTPQYGKIRDPDLDEGDFVFVLGAEDRGGRTVTGGAESQHAQSRVGGEALRREKEALAREKEGLEAERDALEAERRRLAAERGRLASLPKTTVPRKTTVPHKPATRPAVKPATLPGARIETVHHEHGVYRGGERGMRIHCKVTFDNLKDQSVGVSAYFHFESGTALKDFDKAYNSADGTVSTGDRVTPIYESAIWKDFVLFIPYRQLHLSAGSHDLKYYLCAWDFSGAAPSLLTKSSWQPFTVEETGVRAYLSDLNVDYDVFRGGQKGMLIHSKLSVDGLKDKNVEVTAYFSWKTGGPLKDYDKTYNTDTGDVCAYTQTTPLYESTVWKDYEIFMPYPQLHLGVGDQQLRFRIIVWDRSGPTAAQLVESDWYNFDFKETGRRAKVEAIRVDHNVSQGGQLGMRLHSKVTVDGLKDKQIELAGYFYGSSGTALRDHDGLFKSGDGSVSVGSKATPIYPSAIWNDYQLFMPYDQLHMAKGKHDLTFNLIVWDWSSGSPSKLVESDRTSFTFTK